jgi:hypothetical protein
MLQTEACMNLSWICLILILLDAPLVVSQLPHSSMHVMTQQDRILHLSSSSLPPPIPWEHFSLFSASAASHYFSKVTTKFLRVKLERFQFELFLVLLLVYMEFLFSFLPESMIKIFTCSYVHASDLLLLDVQSARVLLFQVLSHVAMRY